MLTFMAAMIWGFGTAGRIEWLAGRALGYRGDASLTHGEACRRVRSAHEVVQRDPIEAFHLMVPGSGRNHLPGLGMSFATKFLYFAGFAAALNRGGAPPLVLDQYVTVALLGSQRRTTDSSNYEAYIRMAHVLDEKRPDAVESALFSIGRERSTLQGERL